MWPHPYHSTLSGMQQGHRDRSEAATDDSTGNTRSPSDWGATQKAGVDVGSARVVKHVVDVVVDKGSSSGKGEVIIIDDV